MNREEIKMLDHIICEVEKCIKNNNVSKDTMFCIPLGSYGNFGYITYDMLLNFKKIQQENKQLKDNWNKLKEIAKSKSDFKLKIRNKELWFEVDELLSKMQELDGSNDILKEVE